MEATTVGSPHAELVDLSSDFNHWIYREVEKGGIQLNGASINTDAVSDSSVTPQIPKRHRWPTLAKDPSWHSFINNLRMTGQAQWDCPEGDIRIQFKIGNSGHISGNLYTPPAPKDITKHPAYRCIRSKAKQISSRWPANIRNRPIVLIICATRAGIEFLQGFANNDFSVDRAIWSALLDHERLPDLDRINVLRQRPIFDRSGFRVQSNRLRVAASGFISVVLIVTLEHASDRESVLPKFRANSVLFENPHARNPLPKKYLEQIKRMDFNLIEYGPGWEAWQGTERDNITMRNLRRSGVLEYRGGKKGVFEVRIPSIQILKILSGERTAEEVFSEYRGPPYPQEKFKDVLESRLTLESVSIVEDDRQKRGEQQIVFSFGTGRDPVVARTKKSD